MNAITILAKLFVQCKQESKINQVPVTGPKLLALRTHILSTFDFNYLNSQNGIQIIKRMDSFL